MHSGQFTFTMLLTTNAGFTGIKAYRGIISMSQAHVVSLCAVPASIWHYSMVKTICFGPQVVRGVEISLHLHKSISSFPASIDPKHLSNPSCTSLELGVAIRNCKSRAYVYKKLWYWSRGTKQWNSMRSMMHRQKRSTCFHKGESRISFSSTETEIVYRRLKDWLIKESCAWLRYYILSIAISHPFAIIVLSIRKSD